MNLSISNIGKIEHIDLEFKGINVIAGRNDTAKSTIGKAVFSLYSANTYAMINGEVLNKEVREKITLNTFNEEFNDNFANKYTDEDVYVGLEKNNLLTSFEDEGTIFKLSTKDFETKVILIDSFMSKMDDDYVDYLKYKESLKYDEPLYVNKNLLVHQLINTKVDKNIEGLDLIIKEFEDNFKFRTMDSEVYKDNDVKIPFSSQSNGTKNLFYIYKLIKNGHVDSNTILILDEPEDELHPEWQFVFSKIITMINKYLGAKLIITTHSSEQIESIVTLMSYDKRDEELRLFVSEQKGNTVTFTKCKNNPMNMFESLNTIYEKIDNIGNEYE